VRDKLLIEPEHGPHVPYRAGECLHGLFAAQLTARQYALHSESEKMIERVKRLLLSFTAVFRVRERGETTQALDYTRRARGLEGQEALERLLIAGKPNWQRRSRPGPRHARMLYPRRPGP
jgi:hypothetical protein